MESVGAIAAKAPAGDPSSRLGVAFGGGGVHGWAHLGVLSVLGCHGLRPGILAGTSAGAITASFVAHGFSVNEMNDIMRSHRTRSLFSLRFDRLALVTTDAFSAYLEQYLGDCAIEDLGIPLAIICTDVESGKEVVLDRGPLVPAILASCALPGIFAPVEIGGRWLMDGGVCNNVPVSALVNRGAAYTIGVQLFKRIGSINPRGDGTLDAEDDELDQKVGLGLWVDRLRQRLGFEGGDVRESISPPNGLEVVQRALDIMMAQIEGYRLQAYRPDVLIVPRVKTAGMLSFGDEKESAFQAGVDAALRHENDLALLARGMQTGQLNVTD
jgi:NTE family protein